MRPLAPWLLAPAAALAVTAAQAQPAQPAEVISAAFGVLAPTGADTPPAFTPTATVPLVEGVSYGWVIQLRTDKPTVRIREELTLPEPARTWPTDPDVQVAPDRRSAVIQREAQPQDGVIYNFWSVAAGDPTGRYRISVSVDGGPARSFEFDVR